MPSEKELLDRIRQLEEQNSALQDKLDMIWAILASDYEDGEAAREPDEFIQIKGPGDQKKPD